MKRLLLDQGVPRTAAALLVTAGWNAIHTAEIGMNRATDVEILARARTESRVCVTLDADFHALLATGRERGPSVIRIRKQGLDAAALAALIQSIWSGIEPALAQGAMVTVTERSVRTRLLPIAYQP